MYRKEHCLKPTLSNCSMAVDRPRFLATDETQIEHGFFEKKPNQCLIRVPSVARTILVLFHLAEIAFLAALDEAFGHALQFFPTRANSFRFLRRDVVVRSSGGHDGE